MDEQHAPAITWTMRQGWYLRAETSRAPRGWYAREYGMHTTTASRQLVAVIHPDDLDNFPNLYPEAVA